jgi:glycosyltransferase involved in cell wall biosynthesis
VCEDLAAELARLGWQVSTTSDKAGRLSRLIDMLGTVWRKRHDYAVAQVDVYSGAAFRWAEAVCRMLGWIDKPYVLTLHGGNLPDFARRQPGRARRLLNSAVAVTTPSRYLFEQMAVYRADLCLHPNPLKLGAYRFRLRQPAQPRLVWLRAFHKVYNPQLAPRALSLIRQRFLSAHLTMIGPDKGDGSLQATERAAAALGVTGQIRFAGRVANTAVGRWLDEGDIFLNTTDFDNTPVSVLEAMAAGLCVVSTNVGGLSYILEDERDALLVPPDDPAAMARAVERILTEPDLAARLSFNARQKVEQFDWAVMLPKWERLLIGAARQGSN